ncbi:hypothetical protein V8F63_00580 [Brevundimonas sp. LF-1]|uniref:hypothetical protein n=1 Tax=Brevundimonas sp. LF-1 TaxID=3126100 RepID=UPI0030E15D09
MRADRRTLLIGAGALMSGGMALGACTRATAPAAPSPSASTWTCRRWRPGTAGASASRS